jgi:Abortive infection alpha
MADQAQLPFLLGVECELMDKEATEGLSAGAKALEHVADFFNKLAGPMAEELGSMFGDKVREYRVKNWIKVQARVEKMLQDAGYAPKPIPPRLFVPLLDGASLENNDTLQQHWAALIANASMKESAVLPGFIQVITQLSPLEAQILNLLQSTLWIDSGMPPHEVLIPEPKRFKEWLPDVDIGFIFRDFERLGLIRMEYALAKKRVIAPRGPLTVNRAGLQDLIRQEEPILNSEFAITWFGVAFLEAVHPPAKPEVTPG